MRSGASLTERNVGRKTKSIAPEGRAALEWLAEFRNGAAVGEGASS